ncbi:MAG: 4-hydroxy-tetrahydrodipicolinate reductase [Vicingaceae bacterium]
MNIAIIGYGKMGKEIEKVALERGHTVSLKISSKNSYDFTFDNLKEVDVAIEFTNPDLAIPNINVCIESNTPVVVGTTGWYNQFAEVRNKVLENNGSLLYATNCSIGVNLFFKLNKQLAQLMNKHKAYNVSMEETHHTQKLDAPSGTAITLAEGIIENNDVKDLWVKGGAKANNQLSVVAHRIENVPGTHQIKYSSEIDDIEIKHTAHNRKGFAMGAVIAAEFITDKKGIFTMEDVLF